MLDSIKSVFLSDARHAVLPLILAKQEGFRGFAAGLKAGWPASLFSIPLALVGIQAVLITGWLLLTLLGSAHG